VVLFLLAGLAKNRLQTGTDMLLIISFLEMSTLLTSNDLEPSK